MRLEKSAVVGLVIMFIGSAFATSATTNHIWVKSSSVNYNANWTTGSFWSGDVAPSTADDVAHLAVEGAVGANGNWRISTPSTGWEVGAVADGMGLTLLTLGAGEHRLRTMKGSMHVTRGAATLVPTAATEPLVIEKFLATDGRTTVTPADGREVQIKRLGGSGRINLAGNGELALDAQTDGSAQVRLQGGTLALGSAAADGYVPGSYLHVDAAKTNLITTETKEGDGRRYVTRLDDADGGTAYCEKVSSTERGISADKWPRPWISGKKVNGVALIDFGALTTDWDGSTATVSPTTPESEFGPGGLLHVVPEPKSVPVREMFFAVELLATEEEEGPTPLLSYGYWEGVSPWTAPGELFKGDDMLRWHTDIRIDGAPYFNNSDFQLAKVQRRLSVLSIAVTNTIAATRYLGGAPNTKRFGGLRLAEMLLYTNVLTRAERRQNIDYLMQKWHVKAADDRFAWDAGTVDVRTDDAAVCVASGDVARVNRLSMGLAADGTELTKTGAGKLVINRSDAASALRVEEGSVAFVRAVAPVDDSALAPRMYAHYDATDKDAFLFEKDGQGQDTDRVLAWRDEVSGRCLTNYNSTSYPAHPTRVTDGKGRACVDFGRFAVAATSSALVLEEAQAGNKSWTVMMEAFIVWRNPADTTRTVFPFSSHINASVRRATATAFLGGSPADPFFGAETAVNGVLFDPFDVGSFGNGAGDWSVLRVSLPAKSYWATLGCQTKDTCVGGCQIGEFVVYGRPLTAEERRNTEAYLMKKWTGEPHPDVTNDAFGSLTFASEGTSVLEVEDDRVFDAVSSAGTLVKRGAGAVEVKNLAAGGLNVEEGSASADIGDDPEALFANALYRFDMSDATTLTTEMEGDVERIVKWKDCRSTSKWAASGWTKSQWNLTAEKRPSRVTETIGGQQRQVVDFGPYQLLDRDSANNYTVTGESSCFQLHSDGGSASGWVRCKETFVVCRDTDPDRRGELVAGWRSDLRRGSNGALFANTTAASTGLIEVDGESCTRATVLPDGWHVVSITTTGTADYIPEAIGGDCGGANYGFSLGGLRIAEVVSFEETNSTVRHAQICDYLRKKWLNQGGGVATTVPSVQVAAGKEASLNLPECGCVRIADLTVGFAGPSSVGRLVIDGAFDLKDLKTLTVSFTPDCKPSRCKGVYRLVSADSLANTEAFANCERIFDCGGKPIKAKIKLAADGIDLEILPFGMMVIVR